MLLLLLLFMLLMLLLLFMLLLLGCRSSVVVVVVAVDVVGRGRCNRFIRIFSWRSFRNGQCEISLPWALIEGHDKFPDLLEMFGYLAVLEALWRQCLVDVLLQRLGSVLDEVKRWRERLECPAAGIDPLIGFLLLCSKRSHGGRFFNICCLNAFLVTLRRLF